MADKEKLKMIQVSDATHGQAKEQSKKRKMTLKGYVEYLLDNDKKVLIREQ